MIDMLWMNARSILVLLLIVGILGPVTEAQSPELWGMTQNGGTNENGVIFSYDINTSIEAVKFNFNDSSGINPSGSLIQASNSYLYGMTSAGGSHNQGTIFSYNTSTGKLAVLHNFGEDTDGMNPYGSLFQANDGLLYGMARNGGKYGAGNIFSYNILSDTYKNVHDFVGAPTDGAFPLGSIIQAQNGLLYGMTMYGGQGAGVIFSYNITTSEYNTEYKFSHVNADAEPYGSLIQGTDSLLYGLSDLGGADDNGAIFGYNIYTDSETVVHSFANFSQGENPRGTLIKADDGLLYGLLPYGGPDSNGLIFAYNVINSTEMDVYNFGDAPDGNNSYGSLIQADNGLLYGMTILGGSSDSGTIFSYNIANGTEIVLHSFSGQNDGAYPTGDLVEVDFPTAVKQLPSLDIDLNIFPNPTSKSLTGIMNSNSQKATAQVIAPDGRILIDEIVIQQGRFEIDVSALAAGVYLLEVKSEGESWVRMFVKE